MDQNNSSSNLNSKTSSSKKRVAALPSLSKGLESASSMNAIATPRGEANTREGLASARERDAPPSITTTIAAPPATSAASGGNNIRVICRIRPINQKELDLGNQVCVEVPDPTTISVRVATQGEAKGDNPGLSKFAFDRVFDMGSTQEEVFKYGAKPAIDSVLEGFNGTIFAYGQTSAGKTHTMQGKIDDPNLRGIIPRMVTALFQHIEESPEHIEFTVKVSIVEIYSEKIRDLVSPEKNNLKVREDKGRGIYIEDVTEVSVASEGEVYTIMRVGNSNRAICATNMNEGSSRSHLVFILSIHQKNTLELSAKTGKLYLIDLAGSEKVGKTGAAGQTLQEAKDINKSLSALGNVINALTDGKGAHIPYRDSKLTRILQESLGGNSKTTLIIACSPSSFNDQETLSTLRFGYRAKSIKNKAKVNKEMTVAELQVLLEKAEKNLAEKEMKIQQLINMLGNRGEGELMSPGEPINISEFKAEKSPPVRKGSGDSAELSEKEDGTPVKKDLTNLLTAEKDDERIKLLESELQTERHNVRIQTERVNELKNHHSSLTMKVIITERENEKLIYKLASMTLKINSLEETVEENESQYQSLDALKNRILAENEDLRKAKRLLTKQLAEKDEEISRFHRLNSFFNVENKEQAEDAGAVSSAAAEKSRKELAFKINEMSKKWITDVTQKAKIAEAEMFQELASAYRQKLKKVILSSNFAGGSESGLQELKKKIAQMEEELNQEKNKNSEMFSENEKLNAEYQKMLLEGIPNLEEITSKAITRVLEEEKAKFEREKRIMAKELEKRVEKITKAELELEKEKDKSNKLEQTMVDNEKSYDFKIENLEASLGQVVNMIKSLDPQGNNRRITASERKPKDKSERLYNIEKQVLETQELVNGLKKTYDGTKDLSEHVISNSISIDRFSSLSFSKNEPFNQYRDFIKKEIQNDMEKEEDFIDEMNLRKSITFTDPRIVKKIRGGNRKTVGTTQDFLALLKSPGTDFSENKSNSSMTQSQIATPVKKANENPLEIP